MNGGTLEGNNYAVRIVQSLAVCVVYCRSLFAPLHLLAWLMYCMSFSIYGF